jgi:hypothetical protein
MPVRIHSSPAGERCASFFELAHNVYTDDAPPVDDAKTSETIMQLASRGPMQLFVAMRGTQPVARLVTQISTAHNDSDGAPLGLIGLFEALDDPEAVSELFEVAVKHLRELGCARAIGPIDGDTWHRYRINAGPFELPPFLLEPYNPSYYASLWEGCGFGVLETYSSKRIDDVEPVIKALSTKYAAASAGGYTFERFEPGDFGSTLERIYKISVEIFRDNFLYSEIGFDEFRLLYRGVDGLVEPDSIWFAKAPDGTDAGFLFSYPNRTAHAPRGDALNFKTLGVLSQHRRGGTGAALMYCGYEAGIRRGLRAANHCLMREGNPSERLDSGQGTVFRRYFLYERKLH